MPARRLNGKVAIVTGAAGGIGAAAAGRLAQEGALLLLTDADEQGAQRLADHLGEGASALHHDVTSEDQWQAVVAHALEAHGQIDILLNNAGVRFSVRVNSLHPGQIDTDMNTRQREKTPELIDKLIRGIPLRRIGTPREVADAIVYLASDESVYVTGSELAIDGGTTA